VLAQASMRTMGRYELGWLQAVVMQDAPDQAPKLAFAPPRDDDEGTEGGIFIGDSQSFPGWGITMLAPCICICMLSPVHKIPKGQAMRRA